jgi:hypothetical protein
VSPESISDSVTRAFAAHEVPVESVETREFPGERWLVAYVTPDALSSAQQASRAVEEDVRADLPGDMQRVMLVVRAIERSSEATLPTGALSGIRDARLDKLIQILEARAKTSSAIPSLHYVQDPRVSLSTTLASRHHLVYGRRGVGKTALLLEAKRATESRGDLTAWLNCHPLRDLSTEEIFGNIASHALRACQAAVPTDSSLSEDIAVLVSEVQEAATPQKQLPRLNQLLRTLLDTVGARLLIFLDDYYLLPVEKQPDVLDALHAMVRDADAWLKIASIKNLTRPFDPTAHRGLEPPQDASTIDLDITLEEPQLAQDFLESILHSYTSSVGISSPARFAKTEALGRLVLASGGVPRDYLTLMASSILEARRSSGARRRVGREDVARAAGRNADTKIRDLEEDVNSRDAQIVVGALTELRRSVVDDAHYTYFRVDSSQQEITESRTFQQLVDLRFAHLINATVSDAHEAGKRFEAYTLDLSQFTKERLRRGLRMLDFEGGQWHQRTTGTAGGPKTLDRRQLRAVLRQAPIVDLARLGRLGQSSLNL